MKINVKDIVYIMIVFFLQFFSSFYSVGNIYFLLSFPFILMFSNYKEWYLFVGLMGMLLASFFTNITILPLIVQATISFT